MIRSNFAIVQLLLLPHAALLVLYLAVVGGGGSWLYFQLRAVETRLLVDEIMDLAAPLAEKLRAVDALAVLERRKPWPMAEVERAFAALPALRSIDLRDHNQGMTIRDGGRGALHLDPADPLPAVAGRTDDRRGMAQRLHAESEPIFRIGFDLAPETAPPVQLTFGFERAQLLERIGLKLAPLRRAVLLIALVGGASLLAALGITALAMVVTRRIEAHYQVLYQRAALTQLAAELVHDLRNPLTTLRANVKALLVAPDQTHAIVEEMDRDIVLLNRKLSGFLKLTRSDSPPAPVDLESLLREAVRLAGPSLERRGLRVDLDLPPDLPRPRWQADAVRDALVNLLVNAAESGQQEGVVRVGVQVADDTFTIVVEDRGTGIAAEHLPRLFDPFYTTRPGGSGLGLAIVERIATDHQGRVRAENRAGGGTRVVLELPLQPREAPEWWKVLRRRSPT